LLSKNKINRPQVAEKMKKIPVPMNNRKIMGNTNEKDALFTDVSKSI